MDRWNSFDENVLLYDIEIEKYKLSTSLNERMYHRDRAASLWDNVDNARRERNTAYIILAGLWGLNMLDTFFDANEVIPSMDLSFELGPSHGAFVLKF